MIYMTQSLHRNLQQRPDAPAVCFQNRTWTYRQFGGRVIRLAGALQGLGVKADGRVAMMSLNSNRYLEYIMAVPWAGGVLVPVNTRWSAAEVAYSLDDAQSPILIVDDKFAPLAEDIKKRAKGLKHVIYAGEGRCPDGMLNYEKLLLKSRPVEDALRRDNDMAGIFYTGGTTGFPKGVMLSHINIYTAAVSLLLYGIAIGPRSLHAAPMFHLADFAMVQCAFVKGATHVVVPGFDPRAVLEVIQNERVTDALLVPTMVQMLLGDSDFAKYDLGSLKRIIYGASPMPLDTVDAALAAMPGIEFTQGFGMTETAAWIGGSSHENHTDKGRENNRIRSAGRAGHMQEVKIVDENGHEVPRHTVGEITVRASNVMMGYWNKPEATAEALKNGWLFTGDAGYMDEGGYVFIVDRFKDMIITGGENVYSAEVENAVMMHPDVAQCAVIGVPSEQWGEAVHAVIVPVPGRKPELKAIRDHCKTLIAGYKCPTSIELIESLPLSGANKVLKTELRKPYWENQDRQVN